MRVKSIDVSIEHQAQLCEAVIPFKTELFMDLYADTFHFISPMDYAVAAVVVFVVGILYSLGYADDRPYLGSLAMYAFVISLEDSSTNYL